MLASMSGPTPNDNEAKKATPFFKGMISNSSHRGSISATMPMQCEAMLAKRARQVVIAARPPNILVDGVYCPGSANPRQKPCLRHLIVKDLNKVASQMKIEVPTTGIFEKRAPMGMYAVFDGLSGAGVQGPATAEFCARNFHVQLLGCIADLRTAAAATESSVEAALSTSLENLDRELLARNPEIADGCGCAIALVVGDHLFIALTGSCTAMLCQVVDGRTSLLTLGRGAGPLKRSLGDADMKGSRAGRIGGALVTSTPDVQTVKLRGSEHHPFLILASSALLAGLSHAQILSITEGFRIQPRAFCGDLGDLASESSSKASADDASEASLPPCTVVQACFLPEPASQTEAPAKKAKTGAASTSGAAWLASQSMRLKHILVRFHQGPKPAEDPKARWASRSRLEAEKLLRRAIAELRKDRQEFKKSPKDVAELILMGSKKFAELAREVSDCETAQKGAAQCGDLGWLSAEARAAMGEQFKEVVDILLPGQWSDIVASSQGLHLVQRIA